MGWSIGWDSSWQRDIGYAVPAYCDHPHCKKEIHRGLSYVCCGQEPYGGDDGCGLYFCETHRIGAGGRCVRCMDGRPPFKPKPEHPRWLHHKQTDPSWDKWRREQKEKLNAAK